MEVYNESSKELIVQNVKVANTFYSRLCGLMFQKELPIGEALLIKKCNSIHTFFMFFCIDVIFINKNNRVIAIYENLKPFKVILPIKNAVAVIELPANTVCEKVRKGDILVLKNNTKKD
ncbi:MAG: DUF192 domain-containing protein [bacterium]